MASDQRWTGGLANREWQRGTRIEAAINRDEIRSQVRQYLTDCRTYQQYLNPRYHPTEEGVLKIVYCRNRAEEDAVRAVYCELLDRAAMPGQRRAEAAGRPDGASGTEASGG